jgi:hypothetical protein
MIDPINFDVVGVVGVEIGAAVAALQERIGAVVAPFQIDREGTLVAVLPGRLIAAATAFDDRRGERFGRERETLVRHIRFAGLSV